MSHVCEIPSIENEIFLVTLHKPLNYSQNDFSDDEGLFNVQDFFA